MGLRSSVETTSPGSMSPFAAEPAAKRRPSVIPPVVAEPGVEQLDSPVTIMDDTIFPTPVFAKAVLDDRKRRMPQCIAHRGYKAKYPENTLLAFQKAVEAGARALETDIHLTKDEVVVLSHDATLKRCFGKKGKVLENTWNEIKDLRTLAAPHVSMPRLKELLDYLSQPGLEEIWLLLDIKLDNNAEDVMRLIASSIADAKPSAQKPWKERIALGIWAAKFLPLAAKYLPGFSVMHIGYKLSYAKNFFDTPNVGFNMLIPMMIAPGGKDFIQDCQRKHNRGLLGWTVNDEDRMRWCIRRQFDGVITDDPRMFLAVCQQHDECSKEPMFPVGMRACIEIVRVYIILTAWFWVYRRRFGPNASQALIQKVK